MMKRPRRFSQLKLLKILSVLPWYLAILGLRVACYGWVDGDAERIRQGLFLIAPLLGIFVFVGGLLALTGLRVILMRLYRALFSQSRNER